MKKLFSAIVILLFISLTGCSEDVNQLLKLKKDYETLQENYNNIQDKYDNVLSEYNILKNKYHIQQAKLERYTTASARLYQ